METTTLYIKNMVCRRCIMMVQQTLEQIGFTVESVTLGEAVLPDRPDEKGMNKIRQHLEKLGFELIDTRRSQLIEEIKRAIVILIHTDYSYMRTNLSDYIGDRLHLDYHYLSKLFSEVEGTTIEKYFIAHRIERVKELLVYDELSLSEIANMLNYSSVSYLSAQFKQVTGWTPSYYKQIKKEKRIPLDEV